MNECRWLRDVVAHLLWSFRSTLHNSGHLAANSSSNSRRTASLELLTFAVHKRILTATLKGLSEGVRRMESVVERVYAKLSAVLLKHPNLRTRLAEQTRSAARNMVLRFDVHGRWKDMEQDRHRHSISPHSQMIQACSTIAPLPEPPPAYVLREIRDQVLNDADQALVLTVIYNSVVDTGLQIDPWAGIDRDDVDERALMFFQLEAYDAQGDGFGLDPCGVESKDSPLLPCDEPTLLHFVSNLTNFASDQSPATHVKLRENDVEAAGALTEQRCRNFRDESPGFNGDWLDPVPDGSQVLIERLHPWDADESPTIVSQYVEYFDSQRTAFTEVTSPNGGVSLSASTSMVSTHSPGLPPAKGTNPATKRRNRGPKATSDELVKRVLVQHHLNHDGTVNKLPLSTREIERRTQKGISDTTAGNILNRLFGSNSAYRKACKSGLIEFSVKVFDQGAGAFGTIDNFKLAETLDERRKPIRNSRRTKPVDDEV